ncbi:unnamed protein product [Owenia fusiformis]|uniref:Heparanase n=1 Tax=Owenia fusiformis TaxID=6347 RepID=A0A8S4NRP0_OWEFU|nr:unnamed protein product [Owenia fusiformis]
MSRTIRLLQWLTMCIIAVSTELIYIDDEHYMYDVGDRLLSIGLESQYVADPTRFDFRSTKLLQLAKGLAPAYLRIGGTSCDFLLFNESLSKDVTLPTLPRSNYTLSEKRFDDINNFAAQSGLRLLFDLNVFLRKGPAWDPTNSQEIFTYAKNKYPNIDWQLGNEPDLYRVSLNMDISAEHLAHDFETLSHTRSKSFPSSLVVGPDTTNPSFLSSSYMASFLKTLHSDNTRIDAVTWHHYYTNGKTAKLADFTDPELLDNLQREIDVVEDIVSRYAPNTTVWLGETSSAYGGGAPGISDRYVAGFMWLDKLGILARHNYKVAIRWSLIVSNYALLDPDLNPNPDYWTSYLYKTLVGGRVLGVTNISASTSGNESDGKHFRVYAHCTNKRSGYNTGSVVVIALNLNNGAATWKAAGYVGSSSVDQYLITSYGSGGLLSKNVAVNGHHVQMLNDETLPIIKALNIPRGTLINMPAKTYGFYVFPDIQANACK